MKKIMVIILTSVVALNAYSQVENQVDSKTTKKLTKAQKMEQRRIEAEETAKLVDWMVENRQFVLEANYLSNQYGERQIVSSNINFIAVDSSKITIQLASLTGIGGANGMGGVTADGTISQFRVEKVGKDRKGYSIRIMAMTHIGSYDITFFITQGGNADATITGTTRGKLNYHGTLVPLAVSKVYKGMTI
jgi:ABC-type microcin C transport system duplicated ATPase subunit YejF